MRKFKVGDKVRGINDRYLYTNRKMTLGEIVGFVDGSIYSDIKVKILEHLDDKDQIGNVFTVNSEDFELVESLEKTKPIIIYRNGKEVVALDKNTGEKCIATCHPEDKFDFRTGAKLAFERLMCQQEKQKEAVTYLNTKICITECTTSCLTVGKIYELKDGKFVDDSGDEYPLSEPIHDLDDLKLYFRVNDGDREYRAGHYCNSTVNFVEIVE